MKKIYRINKDRKIGGVCTGLGAHFGLDPVILRVLFLISIPFGGLGLLIYLVMWVIIPEKDAPSSATKSVKRLYLSSSDKKFAGVCGGLGKYFLVDPSLIRVAFVVAACVGGIGILIYMILWLVIPPRER